jgi:group I intron endonuclease
MASNVTQASGIYRIVTSCGRQYIGSAKNLRTRWEIHQRDLMRGKHHSRFMQRIWNKRGADAFRFEVLLRCSREHLLWYEQRALDICKPELNTSPTAGSQLGLRMSAESKLKMAIAARRTRNFTGHHHSEETKQRIAQKKRSHKYGPYSAERRANIGAAHKGKIITPEQRAQISRKLTGRKQSAETIAKRVAKLRGRKMPPGFAEAQSARMRGRRLSAETIEKIRHSQLNRGVT